MGVKHTPFRTPPPDGGERWEISDPGQGGASGWVDPSRGVGRIESGDPDTLGGRRPVLDELERRFPGVRWFSARDA